MTDAAAYWDERAKLGPRAGTDDIIGAQLERRAILGYVRDGMRVLDAGCGAGELLLQMARHYRVDASGADRSGEMISVAIERAKAATRATLNGMGLLGRLNFYHAAVESLNAEQWGTFDLIVTQRLLINLPTWTQQQIAVVKLATLLKPGGLLLLCENSADGLDELNGWRYAVDLTAIKAPWHNRYPRDAEMRSLQGGRLWLESVEYPTATYAILSRVVNAWQAQEQGAQPEYDAPVNQLALRLPPVGRFGQTRLWVFRREGYFRCAWRMLAA